MEFAYDGGGLGKGGTVTLYIDGDAVGEGRVEQTEAFLFSADETCDVGNEFGSPVTTDYGARNNAFTGRDQLGANRYRRRGYQHPHLAGGSVPGGASAAVAALRGLAATASYNAHNVARTVSALDAGSTRFPARGRARECGDSVAAGFSASRPTPIEFHLHRP